MDPIRFGRGIRALRQRRGWRQEDLATAANVSQSVVSRIELGQLDNVAIFKLVAVARALGAAVDLRLQWQGESLDRLVDAAHAALVEQVVRLMTTQGWETMTEVSFSIYGERGSIDVFARHVAWRRLVVIEVKSAIGDVQATLSALDRKVRNAAVIARERGWAPWPAARILVARRYAGGFEHRSRQPLAGCGVCLLPAVRVVGDGFDRPEPRSSPVTHPTGNRLRIGCTSLLLPVQWVGGGCTRR